MSIKTVQDYSVQTNGLRGYIPPVIYQSATGVWNRNPAWLPMTGFNYSFDSTFSLGTGFNNEVTAIKIQSDGKIIACGFFTTYQGTTYNRIIRLNSDGSIDTSFNIGTGFNNPVQVVEIQSDGKILCGGNFTTYQGTTYNRIIRLNSDGSIDTSFNIGTGFGIGGAEVSAISIQSDGKILCVGTFTTYQGNTYNYIIRLNSDGSVDNSFNIGTGFNNFTKDIKIQPDGKIIVAGNFTSYNEYSTSINGLIRLNSDGSRDTSFLLGTGWTGGGTTGVGALALQSDGKILVGGDFDIKYQGYQVKHLMRINSNGQYDDTFLIRSSLNSKPWRGAIVVQSDGKILIGGVFTSYGGITRNYIARLNYNGTYDTIFDTGTGFNSLVLSIQIQSDAKILVCGSFTTYQGTTRNYIARLNVTEEKVVILKAINANSDFAAFRCSNNYTINWGDGNTENFTANTIANHQYDYANTNLANTNGPVTFTDAGDLVTRTYHGYANNDIITFSTITNTTGINISTPYYVANSAANTFQLSASNGGSILTLTTDGTGTLLPYKQVLITITPQAGANLAQTFLCVRNTEINTQYESGFLDEAISIPNVSSTSNFGLVTASLVNTDQVIYNNMLEQVNILNYGSLTSSAYMFFNCYSLQSVPLFNTANVTSMFAMFSSCYSLQSVPLFNTANVTSMGNMFQYCYSLQSVPLFNTANVTNMGSMFASCASLQSVPLFNTANVTTMSNMFSGCFSLQSVPLFNTAKVTDMNNMFASCYSLQSVPLFNTANVTSIVGMFQNCYSLQSVPLFNTANVTSMVSMFNNCNSLQSVPLFNTAKVTNMTNMFSSCYPLKSVPLFNTANVTSMSSMFSSCLSLQSVPLFNTANVTSMFAMFASCYPLQSVPLFNTANVTDIGNMFQNCTSLKTVPLFNTAKVTNMNNMFNNCPSLKSVPLFNTANVTSMGSMFQSCPSLQSVPLFNTANVTSMFGTFNNCYSLQSVPLFNTAKLTSMIGTFAGCYSLQSVPLFDTANVTSMGTMFNNCTSLKSVPLFNTAKVTDMGSMFSFCYSLQSVPLFNTANVTSMNNMFNNCSSIRDIPSLNCASISSSSGFGAMFAACKITRSQLANTKYSINYSSNFLSNTSLNEIYTNLPTVTGQTITVTGNWGTATDDPTIATAKGWTVTG